MFDLGVSRIEYEELRWQCECVRTENENLRRELDYIDYVTGWNVQSPKKYLSNCCFRRDLVDV